MSYAMVIIWMLSSGEIVGEPWQDQPTIEACGARIESIRKAYPDRLMLVSGCLDKGHLADFTGFYMKLSP